MPDAGWIDDALRARLGPEATAGAVVFEGRSLRLAGARLPLGPARLDVAEAEIELGAGLPLGDLPLSARLVALRGEIVSGDARVPVDFAAGAGREPAWAHGTLRVHGVEAELSARPGSVALTTPRVRLAADLEVDRCGLRYQVVDGTAHGARIVARGLVPLAAGTGGEPLLALRIDGAGAQLVAAVAAIAGLPGIPRLPDDLSLTAELVLRPDRAASGAITAETPRSSLSLQLALAADGSLLGSTLRGRLAFTDALVAGLFTGPVRPRPEGAVEIDTRLSGVLSKPGLSGRLAAPRVVLAWHDGSGFPPFDLEGASVLVDADVERLAWHRFSARIAGGTVAASGRADLEGGAGFHAVMRFDGLRASELPTEASGARELAGVLEGAASGELRVEGGPGRSIAAHGRVTVERPIYLFARRFTPLLAPLGLPPVRAEGRGPLTATLRFERGELLIEPLAAPLDGIHVEGGARVDLDGRLRGRVLLHLHEDWLARSALFALPAVALGRVTVPVDLEGTVRDPRLSTDAIEVLERLLTKNRLNDAVKNAVEGILGAPLTAARRSRRRRR